jgi:excisionase family DNA binding protein
MTRRLLDPRPPARPSRTDRPREWLTIRDASVLAGVSPATLRRWCNAGDIRAFTTPGGHRRFARSAVLGLLPPASRGRPTMPALAGTTSSIIRAYRRDMRRTTSWPASIESLPEGARQSFRECGRWLVTALVEHLDGLDREGRGERLAAAVAAATCQGELAARNGVPLRDTVELFLQLRAPILHELGSAARRRALDATDATIVLEAATDAVDRLMPALIAGHEAVASAGDVATPPTAEASPREGPGRATRD